MNPKTNSPLQTAIKIAIIIVIIVVLLLVSFTMIRLVPAVFSSISRFKDTLSFFGNKEKIALVLDKKSIPDGGNAVLSWKQQRGNGEGEHVLSYPCDTLDENTRLELIEADGDERSVFCEEDISIGKPGESDYRKLTLTGFSDVEEDQILKLTVSHVGATSTYASSSISLTIKKGDKKNTDEDTDDKEEPAATSTPPAPAPKPEQKPVTVIKKPTYTSTYKSPADLFVVFTKADIDSDDEGTVVFQVTNFGQTASGSWRFRAVLPQGGDDVVYNSPYQSSIPAGKTSILTLRFENADSGTVEVVADYYNEVSESDNSNNKAIVKIN